MSSHRNPTRRNRNIGTAKQGHGSDNSLVIPEKPDGRNWLNLMGKCTVEDRQVAGRNVRFIVEENALGCIHPCSIADVVRVLEFLPQSDWVGIQTFVFRQPTRKQLTLSSAWGRLLYYADITTEAGRLLAEGPVIFLEAVDLEHTITWSTFLSPDLSEELERLRSDGHNVKRTGRRYKIEVSAGSARNTQLYRTLLHEVGHWFDWLSKVEEPDARGESWIKHFEAYFARPASEREAFAHRYADQQYARLLEEGLIPFDQLA